MPLIMQDFHLGLANLKRKITETPVFNYKQGQWVPVKHDDQCHLRLVRNVNYMKMW